MAMRRFFCQNENLNARNPEVEAGARPLAQKYQPGTSAGGPIQHDRTFFFFAFEQSWERAQEWSDSPRRYASAINSALGSPAFAGAGVRVAAARPVLQRAKATPSFPSRERIF